jgi:hypothetical protein
LDVSHDELEVAMVNGSIIHMTVEGKTITLNAAFVVSLEQEERKLRSIAGGM